MRAVLSTIMRIGPLIALGLAAAFLPAQESPSPQGIDPFWVRDSGSRVFDNLAPFRRPTGIDIMERGQLVDLYQDLIHMLSVASTAKPEALRFDEGREMCEIEAWKQAYNRAQQNGLKMEGFVGQVLLESDNLLRRRASVYGMFYFHDAQKVIHLISFLPGEPVRRVREDGFRRAIEFLRVHLVESKPLGSGAANGSPLVPKYDFNPLPFLQILDEKQPIDKAQGLWFLTEVLRIRPDLGRAYLGEVADRMPGLLRSPAEVVRTRAVEFLAAIRCDSAAQRPTDEAIAAAAGAESTDGEDSEDRTDTSTDASKDGEAGTTEPLIAWFERIHKELYPPIRHVASGLCELHPSAELDAIIATGRRLLAEERLAPSASARTGKGGVRYGVLVDRVPPELAPLGIAKGSLIVAINGISVRSAKSLLDLIRGEIEKHGEREAAYHAKLRRAPPQVGLETASTPQGPPPVLTFLVEYVDEGRVHLREYRSMQ